MHLHRMIDYLSGLLARAWRAYVDEAEFDPETRLTDIAPGQAPREK